jgi:hypothetical protein
MSESHPRPETQKERWLKYGANVVMTSVVVIVLACLITWLGQRKSGRLDTTAMGLYSLKPQTVNLIKDNTAEIEIVSLFTKVKPEALDADQTREADKFDYVTPITDILEEYARKGRNIKVQVIDPVEQPQKVDDLINKVTERYGGEVKKYKAFVAEFLPPESDKSAPAATRPGGIYGEFKEMLAREADRIRTLEGAKISDPDLFEGLILAIQTVRGFPKYLDSVKESTEQRLKRRPPDYKGGVDSIAAGMSELSERLKMSIEKLRKVNEDPKLAKEIKDFISASTPGYEQIVKRAEAISKRIKDLGELKLDELRQGLRERNTILVMGPTEMRTIPFDKIWQIADDLRSRTPDRKRKPRFGGERQITGAILAVTSKTKPKVVFVRPGGPPWTNAGIPGFQEGGRVSQIADRLRQYNFEVLEKDLSGMWAMQAQMQRMPTQPEPSDEEIKDAIWVVLDVPTGRQQPMAPPTPMGPKLAAHLKAGGSALVLGYPRVETLSEALDEWGIRLRTDAIIVHEPVASSSGGTNDFIEDAQRNPPIFVLKQYGDHVLTKPINSLDGVLVPMLPVETEPRAGYKSAKLLPIPQALRVWGETDVEGVMRDPLGVEYNVPKLPGAVGDIAPPLFAGSAVEKEGGGRVVVIGALQFIWDGMLEFEDPDLSRQGLSVTRFPANAELFLNSVFWLAKREQMIAMSPASMEVNRIGEMAPAVLKTWRIAIVLVCLPGAVILAGVLMYVRRRD